MSCDDVNGWPFLLRHYRAALLYPWIRRGSLHGDDLVRDLADSRPLMGDVVRTGERILVAAESNGWIERGKLAPSPSQRCFGVGGMSGHHRSDAHRSPVEYNWITVWPAWCAFEASDAANG